MLSVVVGIVSDTTDERANARDLGACLEALCSQIDAPSMEILVPHRVDVDGLDDVKQRFPEAIFIPVPDLQVASRGAGAASTTMSCARVGLRPREVK